MSPTWLGCFLGVTQGICHAVEPDHLAAMSTLVAQERRPRAVVRFAAAWGFGHGLTLLAVGGSLLLVGTSMPTSLADACELGVAVMLIFLGLRALLGAHRSRARHAHEGAHVRAASVRRAVAVGMVHGLAGSGALAALVVARLMSPFTGLAFIALYGLGATLGMAIVAGAAGVPLAKLLRGPHGAPRMLQLTGLVSLVVGAAWAWPIARRWFG
jgi:hypothetical protein